MARKPLRIQRRRTRGYKLPPGAIYVGRPTVWGNPSSVVRNKQWWDVFLGDLVGSFGSQRNAQAFAVEMYRKYYKASVEGNGGLLRQLAHKELRNRDLACWCKLCDKHKDGKPFDVDCADCAPCHADILLLEANK